MYQPKEKIVGTGERGTKILRLFRTAVGLHGFGTRAVNGDQERPEAYVVAARRMQEIEAQKAFVRAVANHDKWKAGGPY